MSTVLSDAPVRHLPGKHDQKSHGKGHGTPQLEMAYDDGLVGRESLSAGEFRAALPSGWVAVDTPDEVAAMVVGVSVRAQPGEWTSGLTPGQARAAVARAAQVVAPLVDQYGIYNCDVTIAKSSHLGEGVGGATTLIQSGIGGPMHTNVVMNAGLLSPDSPESAMYAASVGRGWFGPYAHRVTPFERTLTHEMGHVVEYQDLRASTDAVMQTLDEAGRVSAAGSYAQYSPGEMFAEAFADWQWRDRSSSLGLPSHQSDARLDAAGVRRFAYELAVDQLWEGAA